MAHWTTSDIPDQHGRTVLITGANSGLGLHSSQVLAARGARVLMACRNPERGRGARDQVAAHAAVEPELVELDLADLASVRKAAEQVRDSTGDRLDVLMNNAGVMAPPLGATQDGFELQIGTNHLGHAALTWLLMPALRATPGARVVTLSSIAHRGGSLDLDDLNFHRRRYSPTRAYSQSKLANLLFAFELDRRAQRDGLDLRSVAAHPGMSSTELAMNSLHARSLPGPLTKVARGINGLITQSGEQGALPQLYAATAPGATSGSYYGPNGFAEIRGYPNRAKASRAAADVDTARRLWTLTEELTGVTADPA
ncbi:oxidoreductase [Saccharopolyspora gloriosae]|uniref:Protochlorophyllide reductase n=1 Tax=Saccharopolyspora gloriosae TaxID=455344 RepID=A0A840NFY7_9PSEU|nr:oxidoreductase [Saccharopolyspora gloriosae]MBB5068112.1 protochlorophyllide reductase [Saccharopolyspora gloriosae]